MFEVAYAQRLPMTCRSILILPATSLSRRINGYATSTSVGTTTSQPSKHRRVTVFNDDGQVKWGDLSPMEKAARTTQQSFNFGLIAVGAAATVKDGHCNKF